MKTFYKRLLIIGIAVGVFCSLVVFTAGQRQWTAIQLRNKILNSNTYKIVKMPDSSSLYSMGLDYVKEIQSLLPEHVMSAPIAKSFDISIAFEGEPIGGVVTGTGSNFLKLTDLQLIQGRYLSENEIETYQKVCVLKSNIYDLVRTRNAKYIELNGESYEIIGVVSGDVSSGQLQMEGDVFVPVTSLYKYIEKLDERSGLVSQILFDMEGYTKEQIYDLMEEKASVKGIDISELKLMPYLYDEFSSADEFIKTFIMIFLISLFILIIAALNIIHIAIASIMDREREIGLKTALGARTYHILREIVCEIFACVLKGGLVGVAIASVINTLANIYFRGLTFSFNIITIIAGMLLAAIAGLLTSLIPAKKAAELDPSAALREE